MMLLAYFLALLFTVSRRAALAVPQKSDDLPDVWQSSCWHDLASLGYQTPSQVLINANTKYDHAMTEKKCLGLCTSKGILPIIALQNLGACYCASTLPHNLSSQRPRVPVDQCAYSNAACPGNASVSCGTQHLTLVLNTTDGLHPVVVQTPPVLPSLVPYPHALRGGGSATVPSHVALLAASTLITEPKTLQSDLDALNISVSATAHYQLYLRLNSSLASEEYTLILNGTANSSTIVGGSATGLWWGTRTLLQLFSGGNGAAIPADLYISDSPVVAYRGISIDAAREHISMQFHVDTIRKLSSMKMNIYHIHLSDDNGYSLPSKLFANMTSPKLALSKEEWQSIVDCANRYHVQIVPEIDLPGHSAWITRFLPAVRAKNCTAGESWCPVDFSSTGLNQTVAIMTGLLTEVMEIFVHSRYHHLGADEVYETTCLHKFCNCSIAGTYERNCSTQVRFVDPHGNDCAPCILTAKAGYHAFIQRMHRFITSKGRRTIVWEGFDPDPSKLGQQNIVETIDKDILVSMFNNAHHDGWDRTPPDYYAAGYSIINAACSPLYVCPGIISGVDDLALWDPTLFGGPDGPTPAHSWQRLPHDNWWSPSTQSWAGSTNGWPVVSSDSACGGSRPPPPMQIVGASMSQWQMPESCIHPLLFASNCSSKGCVGAGRPAPRVAIMSERVWGSERSPSDLLDRVGCGYGET